MVVVVVVVCVCVCVWCVCVCGGCTCECECDEGECDTYVTNLVVSAEYLAYPVCREVDRHSKYNGFPHSVYPLCHS